MEKLHQRSFSVHSLLNPTPNDASLKCSSQMPPLAESSSVAEDKNVLKNKRKRIKLFGIELDVPYNMNITSENELLFNLRDQILLFSDGTKNQQLLHTQQQPQQTKDTNPFYAFAALSEESSKLSKPQILFQQDSNVTPSTPFSNTTYNQPNPYELPPIKSEIPHYPAHAPSYNTSTPPSASYQDFPGDDEEMSVFLSSLKNGCSNDAHKNGKEAPPAEPEITFIDSHGHKIKITKIHPSAKDPPIEVRLIVDDPKTNPFTQQWMEHFSELKKFKEQYGHTNVTRSIAGYYNLGNWVAEQRRKFKQGKITETQFNCLNTLGFEWDRSYYFFRTRHRKRDRGSDSDEDD